MRRDVSRRGLARQCRLYRVARRVARQARLSHVRRRRRERAVGPRTESATEHDPERSEILRVIRQEVDLLPERYRVPIVLCDLQGLTRDEAADLLGCPAGTVGGRLARPAVSLRDRLERRGVLPSAIFPLPPEITAPADAWRITVEAAARSAAMLAEGNSATPAALLLAERATRAAAAVPVKVCACPGACHRSHRRCRRGPPRGRAAGGPADPASRRAGPAPEGRRGARPR